ncbi:MAG: YkgJ family cysteine cluster protein [Planctomycetes bacterium]|nr:YkgJ family cysteine cluster protein [Planctomycetota bacterium]
MNDDFRALTQIYDELTQEIAQLERIPRCFNCGACCNFNYFEHTPFVTALELQYIKAGVQEDAELQKIMLLQPDENLCPFFWEQNCYAHGLRPLSCRVYFCNLRYEKELVGEIYEKYHRRIQELHEKSRLEYKYMPLVKALRELMTI